MLSENIFKNKTNLIGYAAILFFGIFIVLTHLLSFCIFFLFLYLFTDFFTGYLQKRIRIIPKAVLFWAFNAILIALVVFIALIVVPSFVTDFPRYYKLVVEDSTRLLAQITVKYGLVVNWESIKDILYLENSKSFGYLVKIAHNTVKNVVFFIFAIICNLLIYLERGKIKPVFSVADGSLLSYLYSFIIERLGRFYGYFRKVMGGQLIISLINTGLTTVVVIALGLPNKITLITLVFLCGLLPIVGNIISNTILSVTALISIGVAAFFVCLALLVVIHKLEYFLNSKIIGAIVRLPMSVALLVLLTGEATLGIFGMILAIPVALTIRDELRDIKTMR